MGIGGIVFISMAGLFADIDWHMPFLIYLFAGPVLILSFIFIYEPQTFTSEEMKMKPIEYDKKLTFIISLLSFIGILFFYMIPVQIPFLISDFDNLEQIYIDRYGIEMFGNYELYLQCKKEIETEWDELKCQ